MLRAAAASAAPCSSPTTTRPRLALAAHGHHYQAMLSVGRQRSQVVRLRSAALGVMLYVTRVTSNAVLTMIPPRIACVRHHRPQLADGDGSAVASLG